MKVGISTGSGAALSVVLVAIIAGVGYVYYVGPPASTTTTTGYPGWATPSYSSASADGNSVTSQASQTGSLPTNVTQYLTVSYQLVYADGHGFFHVLGVVLYDGPGEVAYVALLGHFFAANGTMIGVQGNYAFLNFLGTGQSSPFDINSTLPRSSVADFTVRVLSAFPTSISPFVGLKVSGTTSVVNASGVYHIQGQVSNQANVTAQYVDVIGMFYGGSGDLVAAGIVNVTSGLRPGQSISFNVAAPANSDKITSFQVIATAGSVYCQSACSSSDFID